MSTSYKQLEKKLTDIHHIESITMLMHWDNAVCLPANSIQERSQQLGTLNAVYNNMVTSSDLKKLIEEAKSCDLNEWQAANLSLIEHKYTHDNIVDPELTNEFKQTSAICLSIWQKAKEANDFKMVEKTLDHLMQMTKKIAHIKADKLGCEPYEALMDSFDRGRTIKQTDKIFSEIKPFLIDIIPEIVKKQPARFDMQALAPFDFQKQKELSILCMQNLQFDLNQGRLDTSAHPFCTLAGNEDIRITTKFQSSDFTSSLMATIHEAGHAAYERQLSNQEFRQQPVGKALGMSWHESQSLFAEKQISGTYEFFEYITPHICKIFGISPNNLTAKDLYQYNLFVQPSLIRVYADEVTYPLHVIIRYELEKAIIDGEIETKDIPSVWNEYYKNYLNIDVTSDKEGCMQDMHWYSGAVGYFPCYTIGAMLSAQIFDKCKQDLPNLKQDVRSGNFANILEWQKTNIHQWGSLYSSDQLLKKSTGKDHISVELYKQHIRNRYLNS